jgi:hypothetical protein
MMRRRRATRSLVPGDSTNNWWSRGWSKSSSERLGGIRPQLRTALRPLDVHLIYRQWLTNRAD